MSRYKILLLSPLVQGSGNASTVHRLRGHLEEDGLDCQLKSPSPNNVFDQEQGHKDPDLVIGIHAFKSGTILKDLSAPYIVILGGTDVNEFTSQPEAMETMTACIKKARHVVSFSKALANRFHQHWPEYRAVSIIPQGVQVFPSSFDIRVFLRQAAVHNTLPPTGFCDKKHNTDKIYMTPGCKGHFKHHSQNHDKSHDLDESHDHDKSHDHDGLHDHDKSHDQGQSHDHIMPHDSDKSHDNNGLQCSADSDGGFHQLYDIGDDPKLFTIAGGIRKVKNPLYLVQTFSDWRTQTKRDNCYLLIVGHKMENEYFNYFKETINGLPGILYIPGLDQPNMHAAIRDSFVLVNSSDSEGMAVTILEAMLLKTVVLVRGIPGNQAIVTDGKTGLMFDSPEEFIEKAEKLLDDPDQVTTLTQRAYNYVTKVHSLQEEKSAYLRLTKDILAKSTVM